MEHFWGSKYESLVQYNIISSKSVWYIWNFFCYCTKYQVFSLCFFPHPCSLEDKYRGILESTFGVTCHGT